jgi:hypothetical protein
MDVEEVRTNNTGRDRKSAYATADDFCAIFNRDTKSLYALALLLTGDPRTAELSFFSALSECTAAKGVFRPWTRSWTRIAIIKDAVRLTKPKFSATGDQAAHIAVKGLHAAATPILRLCAFDRFVFVLSVLDWYSVRDCAVLLKSTLQEVEIAKERAMQFVGGAAAHLFSPPPPRFRQRFAI